MISTIAWHEFWFTVRKKSYYLVTLGMPLLLIGYLLIVSIIVLLSVPSQISRMGRPVGVVDRSALLTSPGGPLADAVFGEEFTIEKQESNEKTDGKTEGQSDDQSVSQPEDQGDSSSTNFQSLTDQIDAAASNSKKIVLLEDVEDGRQQLDDKTWNGIVVIPEDYIETGNFDVYTRKSELLGSTMGTRWLSRLIRGEILKKTTLTSDEVDRISKSAYKTEFEFGKDGGFEEVNNLAKGLSMGMPLAVAGLLVVALMMNASVLLASIAEEKENKVMEVIVSSVSADQLLVGKVVGIVSAGLLQILIWMGMVSLIPLLTQTAMNEFVEYELDFVQLASCTAFMVMGLMFYGSLLAGMGSLGSTYKDCQQLSGVIITCACVPLILHSVFLSDPNAMVPRVLSMIPFFSPIGMALRLSSGDIAMWEVGLSFAILIISTWFALKVAARLFRAGTLMRGKRPGVREIWSVLTQGA